MKLEQASVSSCPPMPASMGLTGTAGESRGGLHPELGARILRPTVFLFPGLRAGVEQAGGVRVRRGGLKPVLPGIPPPIVVSTSTAVRIAVAAAKFLCSGWALFGTERRVRVRSRLVVSFNPGYGGFLVFRRRPNMSGGKSSIGKVKSGKKVRSK